MGIRGAIKRDAATCVSKLAYYGVALHAFRSDWYIGDWGQRLVIDVEKTLALAGGEAREAEWDELMAWPLEMVKNGEGFDKG
jgi:hypothetical protein